MRCAFWVPRPAPPLLPPNMLHRPFSRGKHSEELHCQWKVKTSRSGEGRGGGGRGGEVVTRARTCYVCMYACMHVCRSVGMYVCMHVCMHACMYACMHVCMYVYTYTYIYAHVHTQACIYMSYLFTYLPACQPACLPTSSHPSIPYSWHRTYSKGEQNLHWDSRAWASTRTARHHQG